MRYKVECYHSIRPLSLSHGRQTIFYLFRWAHSSIFEIYYFADNSTFAMSCVAHSAHRQSLTFGFGCASTRIRNFHSRTCRTVSGNRIGTAHQSAQRRKIDRAHTKATSKIFPSIVTSTTSGQTTLKEMCTNPHPSPAALYSTFDHTIGRTLDLRWRMASLLFYYSNHE